MTIDLPNIPSVKVTDTFSNWLDTDNILYDQVNQIVTFINSLETKSGFPLANLQTTTKTNLIAAINQINGTINITSASIGELDQLETATKASAVSAINEVYELIIDRTGVLSNLSTTDKTDLVSAINEIFENVATNMSDISSLVNELDNFSGRIFVDTGVPSNTIGNNGDIYLNKSNKIIYKKVSGTWTQDLVLFQNSSTVMAGIVQLATQDEVNSGTSTTKAITPSRLRSLTEDSETLKTLFRVGLSNIPLLVGTEPSEGPSFGSNSPPIFWKNVSGALTLYAWYASSNAYIPVSSGSGGGLSGVDTDSIDNYFTGDGNFLTPLNLDIVNVSNAVKQQNAPTSVLINTNGTCLLGQIAKVDTTNNAINFTMPEAIDDGDRFFVRFVELQTGSGISNDIEFTPFVGQKVEDSTSLIFRSGESWQGAFTFVYDINLLSWRFEVGINVY